MSHTPPEHLAERRRARRAQTTINRGSAKAELRSPFERDRDRIVYSASFRRLAVVTQVMSPTEGFAGHNRLTHALKVGQVSRRLAEKLSRSHDPQFIDSLGGLDPDIAESAGLAHDLGHPPFGHVAEEELDKAIIVAGVSDGFEGNAQSFRIITRLETRKPGMLGLDLTRATLAAVLKYPWLKGKGPKPNKFGAYVTEQEDFDFALFGLPVCQRTLEADIMDWADDITYSAHDLEDFYRAGRIPLNTLATDEAEREAFLEAFFERQGIDSAKVRKQWTQLLEELASFFPVTEPYTGSRTHKAALRAYVSSRIKRAVDTTTLNDIGLARDEQVEREVELLKGLTMHYVILTPSLKAQQLNQREIVRGLFEYYHAQAGDPSRWPLFPTMYREQLLQFGNDNTQRVRTVADLIAGMGESQAIVAYRSISNVAWSLY